MSKWLIVPLLGFITSAKAQNIDCQGQFKILSVTY